MNGNTLSNLWLIGASPMAQDYARVLKALDTPFTVIGRGKSSAKELSLHLKLQFKQGASKKSCKMNRLL